MSVYLKDIPFEKAWERWLHALEEQCMANVLGVETIPLDELAVGRVLAEPAWAKICSPHYHASAMDGFAVQAELTSTALPSNPCLLKIGSEGVYVDTGDPLPANTNCVIPIENVESLDRDGNLADDIRKPDSIRIRASVSPWSCVRLMGEDLVTSQLVLPAGHTLRPVDLGAMAACGHTELRVTRKPKVEIIPTGSELIQIGDKILPGGIIEFNSIVLAGQVNQWGASATRHGIVKDDYDLIRSAVLDAAARSDLILLNAGSSAGSEDFSSRIVEELGELLVHGVAIRPGHPVIIGMIKDQSQPCRIIPIVGVPGYPVSAALTAEIFVQPLLALWLGKKVDAPVQLTAKITHKTNSPSGDDDYIRVMAGRVGGEMLAAPLPRGAGVIHSLVKADGITIVPRGIQGLEAGEQVTVNLISRPEILERTLFFSGSHDMTLDVLSDELSRHDIRVVCTNVGSLGGLVALKRSEAHAAGSHLLDPATGEYNVAYIHQYLADIPVSVIRWVSRVQGLIVKKGNPKGIHSLTDLANPHISYINRQRGAGTRVLLDYHLAQMGISKDQVHGYNQEEFTHLAVAAAVVSGRVDCGLGITAAASALDCDFIPLFNEQYELIVPSKYIESELMKPFFEVAHQPQFRKRIAAMPGYEVDQMGEIRLNIP